MFPLPTRSYLLTFWIKEIIWREKEKEVFTLFRLLFCNSLIKTIRNRIGCWNRKSERYSRGNDVGRTGSYQIPASQNVNIFALSAIEKVFSLDWIFLFIALYLYFSVSVRWQLHSFLRVCGIYCYVQRKQGAYISTLMWLVLEIS